MQPRSRTTWRGADRTRRDVAKARLVRARRHATAMGDDMPGEAVSSPDLDGIRRAVGDWLPEHIRGSPRTMRVVSTTRPAVRAAIETARRALHGGPKIPPLPPDPRIVYLVVLEGEFRIRHPSTRTGCWAAVYVTPALEVRGFQLAPYELIPQTYLENLGEVSSIRI